MALIDGVFCLDDRMLYTAFLYVISRHSSLVTFNWSQIMDIRYSEKQED